MTVIIRGLWGDQTQRKRNRGVSGDAREELLGHVARAVSLPEDISQIYVFGEENAELIRREHGREPVVVDGKPWGSPRLSADQDTHPWWTNWGYSTWWHKLRILQLAIEQHHSVVWLDWRAELKVSLSVLDQWLVDLEEYGYFRAALLVQRSKRFGAVWRNRKLHGNSAMHYVVGGGCIFVKGGQGAQLVGRAMEIMAKEPDWNDQQCLMKAHDDSCDGKWVGEYSWLRNYEITGYQYGRNRFHSPSHATVWQIGARLPREEHDHQIARDLMDERNSNR